MSSTASLEVSNEVSLEEYMLHIKHIADIILEELKEYITNYKKYYNDGPGYYYTFIKQDKLKGKHSKHITIDNNFLNINSDVGNFRLGSSCIYNYNDKYKEKINNIIRKLNLTEKVYDRYFYNTKYIEKYYEYPKVLEHKEVYESSHTTIKDTWNEIK